MTPTPITTTLTAGQHVRTRGALEGSMSGRIVRGSDERGQVLVVWSHARGAHPVTCSAADLEVIAE